MHFLYFLFSKISSKYYVGETHDLEERISNHNTHHYSGAFTKIADDWQLVFCFECVSKSDAQFLEKFVKRMKSKTFIEKVISNPEILADILSKK